MSLASTVALWLTGFAVVASAWTWIWRADIRRRA